MRGFIFIRNLTTNQPVKLDYDYYFYSSELISNTLDDAPQEFKELLENNTVHRIAFIKRIISELEDFLGKPIIEISAQNYQSLKDKYNILSMEMCIPLFETSRLSTLVDVVIKQECTMQFSTQTFTKFHHSFTPIFPSVKFTPNTNSEVEVLNRILKYPMEDYALRKTRIAPKGVLISSFLSCGVISISHVLKLAYAMKESPGRDEFIRQVLWAYYSKVKVLPDPNFPPLTESKKALFKKYISGTLEGGYVENELNKEIKTLVSGGSISNRSRLMLSYYLIIKLDIYWEYGELFFRSALEDYHPKINRYNWFAQTRNRFLKSYNLERQLNLFGDK